MPGFDRTGPGGMGPRTGRGLGFCPPGAGPAYYGPGVVRGVGRGGIPWGGGRGRAWGGGRGWGWWGPCAGYGPYYGLTPEQEVEALQHQASFLEQQIQQIRERIGELKGKEPDSK